MKGIDKLIAAVKEDCANGQGCFNPDGCNQELYRYEDETDPKLIERGIKKRCVRLSKCNHKYCDKFKWALDRADQYAKMLCVTRDEVLDAWEIRRNYWYMNYYQECNQPSLKGSHKVVKVEDWLQELRERFGPNSDDWKFVCPSCGHVQSLADFKAVGQDPNLAYQCCIGRYTGSDDHSGKNGCKYTINGLIALNTLTVVSREFIPTKVFDIAKK